VIRRAWIPVVAAGAVLLGAAALAAAPPEPVVEFNRDIRPILSENCYQCHGPDKNQRQGGLRLDLPAGALADLGGRRAITPGNPAKSELLHRVITSNDGRKMPPESTGKRLTRAQTETLRRWISQGAKWQKHWSLLPPPRTALPPVRLQGWVRNPIDRFVLDRLEREGLRPAPEADRATLIRRVSLDLTGIPPTPQEVDAFVMDRSPGAYERVVDGLLRSPRFGEKLASRWLDAARYADTNGYQSDGERFMWRWRDWVIDAFNRDMPYDRFTVEQLAGDLLPNATLEQKIASGFNRNHRGNGEGGIIPEEYQVEYVVDRVETTSTVFLGLTLGCARCHDHKFDPLSQKDFYRFYAYFNNLPERGRANKYGNSPPLIPAPTAAQQAQLAALEQKLTAAEKHEELLSGRRASAQTVWERELLQASTQDWSSSDELECRLSLDNELQWEGSSLTKDAPKTARFVGEGVAFGPGKVGAGVRLVGRGFVDAGNVADFGFYDRFTLAAWFRADDQRGGTLISRMTDADRGDGYSLVLRGGRVEINLVKRWLDDALRMESKLTVPAGEWHHVAVTYDGSRVASGVRVYLDGAPMEMRASIDELNQSFNTTEPFRIGGGHGPNGRFHGQLDEVRVYRRVLDANEAAILATSDTISAIAAQAPALRTQRQSAKLAACFVDRFAPEEIRRAHSEVVALRKERARAIDSFPTVMVMEEMPVPRDTFVLIRGQYDKHGEKVSPGVPGSLPALSASGRNDRLALARWIVDPANPLTSRVAVNRYWQMLFGVGLVKSAEDFGSQGEPPSHPELLDYLASVFATGSGAGGPVPGAGETTGKSVNGTTGQRIGRPNKAPIDPGSHSLIDQQGLGWSTKRLLKLIVTSATYRQSSRVTPGLTARDPENRLLARGPRFRLPAETVRDQALAASGLLVEKLGGPSVKPYQPAGIWKDLTGGDDYVPGTGEDLYRRGLYTFWKRTAPPPALSAFDAAGRETCVVRENRTNTPLQALNLMNDVTFVEAARGVAQRVLLEGSAAEEERVTRIFRRILVRRPRPEELRVLTASLRHYRDEFRREPQSAAKLLKVGDSKPDPRLEAGELAAYTTVASLVLNLDEAVTKE